METEKTINQHLQPPHLGAAGKGISAALPVREYDGSKAGKASWSIRIRGVCGTRLRLHHHVGPTRSVPKPGPAAVTSRCSASTMSAMSAHTVIRLQTGPGCGGNGDAS